MNILKTIKHLFIVPLFCLAMVPAANAVPFAADVLFVVDESGSMFGEHAWIGNMVTDLETGLQAAGVGTGTNTNNYGLVGFGAVSSHGTSGHKHAVGGGDWGTAADLSTAAGGLIASGGTEDGWEAIAFGLNNYSFRAGAALNIILITDEDRDVTFGSTLTYNSMLTALQNKGALLNAVVNCGFSTGAGAPSSALGIDNGGDAYLADGSGGYTTGTGGKQNGNCFGTTNANYVNLALATGGAAWDLDHLRAGGLTATSFSNAFVDIKVQEIITPPNGVPEPSTLALLGLGLIGAVALRRRQQA